MNKGKYSVTLRAMRNGSPGAKIDEYRHDGQCFVEGRPGSEYCLEIRNNSSERVLAVPSVDGLSVMDGEKATNESGGYIIEPYDSIKVKGYRHTLDEVGAFKFTEKGEGYASSKGSSRNAGVISVKFYAEKEDEYKKALDDLKKEIERLRQDNRRNRTIRIPEPYPVPKPYPVPDDWWRPWRPRPWWESPVTWGTHDLICKSSAGENTAGFNSDTLGGPTLRCMAASGPAQSYSAEVQHQSKDVSEFNLETGWGQKVTDRVREIPFTRGHLLTTIDIYYSDRNGLKEMDVPLKKKKNISYPKGFATPPAGWGE